MADTILWQAGKEGDHRLKEVGQGGLADPTQTRLARVMPSWVAAIKRSGILDGLLGPAGGLAAASDEFLNPGTGRDQSEFRRDKEGVG